MIIESLEEFCTKLHGLGGADISLVLIIMYNTFGKTELIMDTKVQGGDLGLQINWQELVRLYRETEILVITQGIFH